MFIFLLIYFHNTVEKSVTTTFMGKLVFLSVTDGSCLITTNVRFYRQETGNTYSLTIKKKQMIYINLYFKFIINLACCKQYHDLSDIRHSDFCCNIILISKY